MAASAKNLHWWDLRNLGLRRLNIPQEEAVLTHGASSIASRLPITGTSCGLSGTWWPRFHSMVSLWLSGVRLSALSHVDSFQICYLFQERNSSSNCFRTVSVKKGYCEWSQISVRFSHSQKHSHVGLKYLSSPIAMMLGVHTDWKTYKLRTSSSRAFWKLLPGNYSKAKTCGKPKTIYLFMFGHNLSYSWEIF